MEMLQIKFKRDEEDEGGMGYMVISGKIDKATARDIWEDAGGYPDGFHCSHEHDCCGCTFSHSIHVRATNSRTLITQRFGRNV